MRYNKAILDSAIHAARRGAQKDGRIRFVFATAYGYQVCLKDPKLHQSYYCIGASSWAKIEYLTGTGHVWSETKPYAA